MKNEKKDVKNDKKPKDKKNYERPEVTKHGSVEKMTQLVQICPSGPLQNF